MEQVYKILKKMDEETIKSLTKKSSHCFYIRDINFEKIKAIADKCDMTPSKVLDEIINQLPEPNHK